ncbi:VanZ family protein, partial [Clostridium paraputrificum]
FGLITPYIFKELKNLKSMLITSLIISCSIETIQLIEYILSISENTRITDINDIILNVLGSFIGFYILKKFKLDKIRE